ncbi:MAG: oligosaccharyl transferase, archaeosortase A system-associated [Methanoregula sp.]
MTFTMPNWKSRIGLAVILLAFMAIALLIRLIPALFIKDSGFLYTLDTDTWFTLRQVEVMVNHFPQYDWFDPMTAFPTGKVIDWGPLFPFITAALCLITGATTHSAIIYVSSFVAPLMAALMVPVSYFLGKTIWDRKTGIVAAGLISVVSLAYFSLTTFGLVIHHIGELLFSSLFFLVYLYYLTSVKCSISDIKKIKPLLVPVAFASLAGVLYFLALLTSTTTLLVLAVIAIFTFVQQIVDHLSGRPSEDLLILNVVFLSVTTVLLVLFGFKQTGTSVTSYTIGLVYVNLLLIAETIVLYGVSTLFQGKIKLYLVALGALAVAGIAVILIYPPLQAISQQGMTLLFGSSNFSIGVLNTAPLTLALAWDYFNVALILAAGGFLVLLYHSAKTRKPAWILLLVWSAFMLLLTVKYQRFAYFSTVTIVLLSAICITEPFTWKKTDGTAVSFGALISLLFPSKEQGNRPSDKSPRSSKTTKPGKGKKPSRNPQQYTDDLKVFCLGTVVMLAVVLFFVSAYNDANLALTNPNREIPADWINTVNWLGNATPSPGVDYYQQYDASTYTYPPEAYGVLASWDAGHWITFFSHRIPITNPFQDHLSGSTGAYAFYLSENETAADTLLQGLGGRYVITDSSLAVDEFSSLALWVNNSVDVSPYMTRFTVQGGNGGLSSAYLYDDAYFRTMVVRLQNFDGSLQVPGTVNYIRYRIQQDPASGGVARVLVGEQPLDLTQPDNSSPIIPENGSVPPDGVYANAFSGLPNSTLSNVPALNHFRLVHESPDDATVQMVQGSVPVTLPGIKYVKIFEYVKGARIPGEGIIEIPLRTNTGRMFVYTQESQNGTFIVPYSTSENPYDVQATGPYHIDGTDRYINVTEDDVINGTTVG